MIIRLVRQGGFTGIPFTKTIDTTKIDPDKAKEIENGITNYELSIKPNQITPVQTSSDRFTYILSIQDQEISREIKISEEKNAP